MDTQYINIDFLIWLLEQLQIIKNNALTLLQLHCGILLSALAHIVIYEV